MGIKMALKPKNNYRFLNHKLWAFQWYITCHDIRKLNFCHFLMYELQNGFKMSSKLKNNYRSLKHRLWAFQWYKTCYDMKKMIFCHFWCTSFKMGSKWPSTPKTITDSAHTFTFPMIYNMSWYEKVDFLSFLMYELQNGFKMSFKPKNNYRILKHKFSAFQLNITCHDMKKLIFRHILMYKLQNGFKMSFKPKQGLRRTRKLRQCTNWKVSWFVKLVRPAGLSNWSV